MPYIYILSNKKHGTIYIGVTNNLVKRIHEHKEKIIKSFSQKYDLTKLVYYEVFDSIVDAIAREKNLKNWKREWKVELIEKMNPEWEDLYYKIV